ncbi:TPA: hypothetical protein ACGUPI_003182 [Vibrio vulnificus]
MRHAQQAFVSLVTKDFSMASFEDVKTVALAMWHEGFVPSVENLPESAMAAAGYVVDKLMRFNCVSVELKERLRNVLDRLRASFSFVVSQVKGCDKLALDWGLSSDLRAQVRELLPYQTRHYVNT